MARDPSETVVETALDAIRLPVCLACLTFSFPALLFPRELGGRYGQSKAANSRFAAWGQHVHRLDLSNCRSARRSPGAGNGEAAGRREGPAPGPSAQ